MTSGRLFLTNTVGIVLALLAIGPVGAEQVQGSATVQVDSATLDGDATFQGPLQGILITGQDNVAPEFSLRAPAVHLEEDYADAGTTGGGTVSIGTERQRDSTDYTDVKALGSSVQSELHALVYPLGFANLTTFSRCLDAVPPEDEFDSYVPWVAADRNYFRIDLVEAVDLRPCSTAFLRIEGDFLFVMWGWSATMTHAQGSRQLESGNLDVEGAPPVLSMAGVNQIRENYLFVTQGVLELEVLNAGVEVLNAGVSVYGGQGNLSVDGSLLLQGATGTIPLSSGEVQLDGDVASLTGTLNLAFVGRPTADSLSIELSGDVSNVVAPGATIVTVEPASPRWWGTVAAIAGPLLGVGLVTYFVPALHYQAASRQSQLYASLPVFSLRHRRAVGYWIWASWLAAHQLPRLALALAGRSARLYQLLPEPHHLRASILKTLGRELDAMAEHDVLSIILTDADDRVGNACEAASILIARGEEEKARGWLTRIVNDLGPNVDASTLARLESVCLRLGMRPGQGGDRPGFT